MTPRQRYPEIWAATFGAAWMRFFGEPNNVHRARIAGIEANLACQSWHEAEEARWAAIEAADVAKLEAMSPEERAALHRPETPRHAR